MGRDVRNIQQLVQPGAIDLFWTIFSNNKIPLQRAK